MSSSDDPYYVFRDDMQQKLELVDEKLETFKRVAQDCGDNEGSSKIFTARFKEAKKELKKSLRDAELTLHDLDTCVHLMQQQAETSNRQVDEREIYNRTSFVTSSRNRLSQAKQGMNRVLPPAIVASSASSSTRRILGDGDASVGLLSGGVGAGEEVARVALPSDRNNNSKTNRGYTNVSNQNVDDPSTSSYTNSSDQFLSSVAMMKQQDESLDELDAAVTRVGYMAETIGEEINDQNKMLDDMEVDLEKAEEDLGLVMGKLSEFMQTKDPTKICTIVALFFVAVFLLFLIIYT